MSDDSPRILCVGETMGMIAPVQQERLRDAQLFRIDAGGAESNVAAHTAALGIPSTWFSRLGNDEMGRRIATTLTSRGIDVSPVIYDDDAPTGVYFKDPGAGVVYYRSTSAASKFQPADAESIDLSVFSLLHLSGITCALSESAAAFIPALIERAREHGLQISFDMNFRAPLWPKSRAETVLKSVGQRADIVFTGLDEAENLWGTHTPEQVRDLFPEVAHLVIKDGDVGATEFNQDGSTFEPAIPTKVVEAVGAGDAFAGGYLAAFLTGHTTAERLRSGHQRASLTLQTTSDFIETT